MTGFIEFMQTSFLHVLPIITAGVFALAIVIERLRALYQILPLRNQNAFFERIQELVMGGRIAEAVALCEKYPTKPVANVAKRALLRAHQPDSLIENGLDLAVEEESQRVYRRTSFLAMIANVATLLGLLGTIAGLVTSFKAIGTMEAQEKATYLANGIAQAMNATMFGLAVAIPAMISFSFLMNRTNHLISDIESSAVRTMDIIKQRYFEAESRSLNQASNPRGLA